MNQMKPVDFENIEFEKQGQSIFGFITFNKSSARADVVEKLLLHKLPKILESEMRPWCCKSSVRREI